MHPSLAAVFLAGALSAASANPGAQRPSPAAAPPGLSQALEGRPVSSAAELKDELAEDPKLERTWKTKAFGEIDWWSGTGNDSGGTTEVRNHYVVVRKGGRQDAFLLDRAISGGGNAVWSGTSARLRRVAQLDRGARSYLWVEFEEQREHTRSCLGEDGSTPSGIMARTKRSVLRGFVLTLAQGKPILVARDIPVIDSQEPAENEAAQCGAKGAKERDHLSSRADEARSQIDVDVDAGGHLVVKARTPTLTPAQKPWVGTFAIPNVE